MLKSLIKNKRRGNRIEHWLRQKDKALPQATSWQPWSLDNLLLQTPNPRPNFPQIGNIGIGGALGGTWNATATSVQAYMNAVASQPSQQGAI